MTPHIFSRRITSWKVFGLVLGLVGALYFTFAPYAQVIPATCDGSTPCFGGAGVATPEVPGVPSGNLSITDLILQGIAFIFDFVLALAVLMIIIAGLYLIVSNGDEGSKDKAKRIVIYTIAGIVLILFSRAIVTMVANFFRN